MSRRPDNGYAREVAESVCHVFNRSAVVQDAGGARVVDDPFTWDDLGRYIVQWCEIRDDGLWLRSPRLDGPDDPMHWSPASEVQDVAPLGAPLLPFPFSSNQLAAFMLAGVGAKVASVYGSWDTGPDESGLREVSRSAMRGMEVLKLAYTAYRQSAERVMITHSAVERDSPKWIALMAQDLLISAPVVLDDASAAASEWGDRFWWHVFHLRDRVGQEWDSWIRMPLITLERAAFLLSGLSPNLARETDPDALIADRLAILAGDGANRTLLDWVHDLMELEAGEMKPRRYGRWVSDPVASRVPTISPLASGAPLISNGARTLQSSEQAVDVMAWGGVWSSVGPYLLERLSEWRSTSAKEFYKALWIEAESSDKSPFVPGEGNDRGVLVIGQTRKPLALKTMQNQWGRLKEAANSQWAAVPGGTRERARERRE